MSPSHLLKALLTFMFLTLSLQAQTINGIAAIIDDEIITLYEIEQQSAANKISQKNALKALIRERLEASEARKRNITVTGFDVSQEVERIAKFNQLSASQLFDLMENRGVSRSAYEEDVKQSLLKQRLYQAISYSKMQRPTQQDIAEYYELHPEEFQKPTHIDVVAYSSAQREAIQQAQQNPMMQIAGVNVQSISLESAKISPQLLTLLAKTPNNRFTQIVPNRQGYVSFLVRAKHGNESVALEEVTAEIEERIMASERDRLLNDYFQKLQATAKIKILREPS